MKKLQTVLLGATLCLSLGSVTGCSSKTQIGILQPVEHNALGEARDGFIAQLSELGYVDGQNIKIDYQNANGEESNQTTLAKSLTAKCDMTLGIGTGATQALHSAQINSGSTNPILFTAVTDAVAAGLVSSNQHPGGYITGTSDANPVEAQIDLIKECIPDADKIGILYTQSEINSEVQANSAKAEALAQGLAVEIATCTDSNDIKSVATNLCNKEGIDAIFVPTDNNIAANMPAVRAAAEQAGVLIVAGEEGMVKSGGHITLSVSYYELGRKTARMAVEILEGRSNPADIPVTTMDKEECVYVMSSKFIEAAGIVIPSETISKFDDIDEK